MYALSIPRTHFQYPGWVTNAMEPPKKSKVAESFGELVADNRGQGNELTTKVEPTKAGARLLAMAASVDFRLMMVSMLMRK